MFLISSKFEICENQKHRTFLVIFVLALKHFNAPVYDKKIIQPSIIFWLSTRLSIK